MEERDSNGKEARLKAIQSLSDWSKWLISVNFAAATGCVLVLRGNPAELVRPMLLLAIVLFSLSALCSVLFVFLLSTQVEKIAEIKEVKYKQLGADSADSFRRRAYLPSRLGHDLVARFFVTRPSLF